MKSLWTCRRTFLGLVGIIALFLLGCCKGTDVSWAIASISIGLSAANAYQGMKEKAGPPVEGEQK